jgi:endo-alpha-1,4-polygalactosaminidase (GH114 family)
VRCICRWTGIAFYAPSRRSRVHPQFQRVTRNWPRSARERYAQKVRALGTLNHPQLRVLVQAIRQELYDTEARRLDRRLGAAFDAALARDET